MTILVQQHLQAMAQHAQTLACTLLQVGALGGTTAEARPGETVGPAARTLATVAVAGSWRWDEAAFVRAWEAGVFGDSRVELVQGEVWPVSIGDWHGAVAANVARALPNDGWRITLATLPSAGSLPDPDVWVRPRLAEPMARLGTTGRLTRWAATDVVLVVEVADTSFAADTEIKPAVYGAAGYRCYWVLHRGGAEIFTDPFDGGYRSRSHVDVDGEVVVPYAPVSLAVSALLDAGP